MDSRTKTTVATPGEIMTSCRFWGSLIAICVMVSSVVRADVIRLVHGGEVRGELESNPIDQDAPVIIRTMSGAIVEIDRSEIEFVKQRTRAMEEYISLARAVEPSVQGHWELADWCRSHSLPDQREEQLERLLEYDPEHKDARRILGHVQHNGNWMPREEMMAARGYVKHNRKWVTRQELAIIEKSESERKAEVVWYPRVRLWVGWITAKNSRRRIEGIKNFNALRDADAVPAMRQLMSNHDSNDIRMLYVTVLGQLSGTKSVEAILDRFLFDGNDFVRRAAFESLRPDHYEVAVPMLITGLKNDTNVVVNRAATALQAMNDPQAVPYLIDALVTSHKYKVQVPTGNKMSFGNGPNGPGMVNQNQLPANVEAMARTGQLPYGAVVKPFGGTQPLTKTVTVRSEIKNRDVLAALESITGQNLGYNERDWQVWWSIQQG